MGCGGILLIFIGILFAVTFAGISGQVASNKQEDLKNQEESSSADSGDAVHTPRKKLDAESCEYMDFMLEDRLGWISDTEIVEGAMNGFYEATGVQPYLIICDNIEGIGGEITDEEALLYLNSFYDSLYGDEGHMIFVFMEYDESEYVTFLYTGKLAEKVMDEEAREIFLDNADYYYTDESLSDEEYFARVFLQSASQIMD